MRALRFDGSLRLGDQPAPAPGPGDALVRVRLAGICNTDVEIARGYMGFVGVLGHEFVGDVVAVGAAEHQPLVGARVVGEINLGCGACRRCRHDLSRHCPHRTVLGILGKDGALADELTLPVANLHRVADGLDDERAVFAEPLAAAFEILEQLRVEPGWRVAILGDGKLGLLCAQALALTGCELWVEGRHRRKLAHAEAAGARVGGLEGEFDLVVEATGSPAGLDRALSLVRPRGTVVLKSTFHGAPTVQTAKVVIDEISIVGSRCGPFAPALRAMAAGRVDPRPLIDATYPLADALEAFEHAQRPGVLKVLLRPLFALLAAPRAAVGAVGGGRVAGRRLFAAVEPPERQRDGRQQQQQHAAGQAQQHRQRQRHRRAPQPVDRRRGRPGRRLPREHHDRWPLARQPLERRSGGARQRVARRRRGRGGEARVRRLRGAPRRRRGRHIRRRRGRGRREGRRRGRGRREGRR